MRIIAGRYRGKKLKEFELATTKPTLDRVKESIFSSIQFDIIDARVLDLFAGTGALGVESLSRGASSVDFVDANAEAIKIIKQNLIGIDGKFSVTQSDYMNYLIDAKSSGKKYDIVLLDPPFASDYGEKAIEYILANNLLSDSGIIIYEKANDTPFELSIEGYTFKHKKYGTVGVVKITRCDD
ncbi:MAG: 16S rRNA (guanine(966)-N(2))-methyltransferase RsmD [Clostridia bacterium]|nr:16S rRNA (guanine(966)-N(2))-methyltransferase RsmD [Clostridia bacterium]